MIRLDMIRQNTNDPDRRKRHPSRASCVFVGRRYETTGPAPVYKLTTLLWLHGHGGEEFEVWDDVSPFGKPGGLAMRGTVRNWVRLVKGKITFDRQAEPTTEFTPDEVNLIARAAGKVSNTAGIDSLTPGNARTSTTRPPDGPEYPREQDRAPAALVTVHTSAAA